MIKINKVAIRGSMTMLSAYTTPQIKEPTAVPKKLPIPPITMTQKASISKLWSKPKFIMPIIVHAIPPKPAKSTLTANMTV